MTPEEIARIRYLLLNFDTWLEENSQYEDEDGEIHAHYMQQRDEIAAALEALPEEGGE